MVKNKQIRKWETVSDWVTLVRAKLLLRLLLLALSEPSPRHSLLPHSLEFSPPGLQVNTVWWEKRGRICLLPWRSLPHIALLLKLYTIIIIKWNHQKRWWTLGTPKQPRWPGLQCTYKIYHNRKSRGAHWYVNFIYSKNYIYKMFLLRVLKQIARTAIVSHRKKQNPSVDA